MRTMRSPEVASRARDLRDKCLCITEGWNAAHFLVIRDLRVFPNTGESLLSHYLY